MTKVVLIVHSVVIIMVIFSVLRIGALKAGTRRTKFDLLWHRLLAGLMLILIVVSFYYLIRA